MDLLEFKDFLTLTLPRLNMSETPDDPDVPMYFYVLGIFDWIWFPYEYDGIDLLFGYVYGDFPELGMFSVSEIHKLAVVHNTIFVACEYPKPLKLSEIKKIYPST